MSGFKIVSLFPGAGKSPTFRTVPQVAEATEAISTLNDAYIAASRASDVVWFRDHMADECIIIFGDGRRLRKPEFLDGLIEAPTRYVSLAIRNVTVRVFGSTAQVDAEAPWELENGFSGVSRYIDTYVWSDGRWQVVSAQVTWL